MKIMAFGITDVGLKRTNNEDAFVVRPDLGFWAVADGMGGAAAGEVASRIFVETATEAFASNSTEETQMDRVKNAFTFANSRMLGHVASHPEHAGMGCTAEILAISGDDIFIGHVGDSRTYRLRNAELKQLSVDHSLVAEQIKQGLISEQDARNHAMRHVILRAVGAKESVELDLLKGKGLPGDVFLLCSDGLTDMVDDAAIRKCLTQEESLQALADQLIELAKAAGGKDNITVVLVKLLS
jgi:serine/threonine protein phosphatase PrpC